MKVVKSRSPYFITVDEVGQEGSRLELFIWHKGETEPTIPNYALSAIAASPTQTSNTYNIAPFIRENINIVAPNTTNTIAVESNDNWVYCKVKSYSTVSKTETLILTETYIVLKGYTDYLGGYNQSEIDTVQVLTNPEITRYFYPTTGVKDNSYFNLLIQKTIPAKEIGIDYFDAENILATIVLNSDNDYLYRIPFMYYLNGGVTVVNISDEINIATIKSTALCEGKYTPVLCGFVNSFGGWGFLTFFKAKSETYETKSKDFSLLPDNLNYNPLRGQMQKFNFESKKGVKLNTGWVDENYSNLLEQLFNSETILLDQVPVQLKSSSFQLKTHLKDRVINYELEFEYNFNQINNVQ